MSLRSRLYCGFFVMIFLAMVIGVLAIVAFRTTASNVGVTNVLANEAVEREIPVSMEFSRLANSMEAVGGNYYAYMMGRLEADFRDGNTHLANAQASIGEIQTIFQGVDAQTLPAVRRNIGVMVDGAQRLDAITERLYSLMQDLFATRAALEVDVERIGDSMMEAMLSAKKFLEDSIDSDEKSAAKRRLDFISVLSELMSELESGRVLFWKAQGVRGDEAQALYKEQLQGLEELVSTARLYNNPQRIPDSGMRGVFSEIQRGMVAYAANVDHMRELDADISAIVGDMLRTYKGVNEAVRESLGVVEQSLVGMNNSILDGMGVIERTVSRSSLMVILVVVTAFVLGVVVAMLLTRSITNPVNRIISTLSVGSDRINAAAVQIAAASQDLAEGVATQAASLEQTSSALEQMASGTRQNADNAKKTYSTTVSNNKIVESGVKAMGAMDAAMTDINDKSERVSQIVKTIEEIAFQTNLLALNAAVEAARAGEAGKGFAVVADEVRNLSQRSAQAAKDTTDLILGTVESVKNGMSVAVELTDSFGKIEKGSHNVGALIEEIATATDEQAQGVEQVNTAVAQMDKVTQQNASSSEQTASSAEELSTQAEGLALAIGELVELVSGRGSGEGNGRMVGGESGKRVETSVSRLLPLARVVDE